MAACAAADEIAMFGGIDLQCHSCSPRDRRRNARCPGRQRRCAARRAWHRMPRRPSRRDRPRNSPPSAGTARSRASPAVCRPASTASCWLPSVFVASEDGLSLLFALPSAVDFAAVLGVPVLLPLVTAPIRIVARWRTRTVRRVLLRLLDQGSCDLDQLPRQFLQLFPGQIPEPLAVHVTQLICSEMRQHRMQESHPSPRRKLIPGGLERKPTNCCIFSTHLARQGNETRPTNLRTPLWLTYDPQPAIRN